VRSRLAIVYRSGLPPAEAWSGSPAGLASGLAELGLDSVLIDCEPRPAISLASKAWATAIRGNRTDGLLAPEIFKLREMTGRLRSRREPVTACVQMGSDFGDPLKTRRVILIDMTVTQGAQLPGWQVPLAKAGYWIDREKDCYPNAVACCVGSRWTADSLVNDYGVPRARVHVVGFGRNFDPRPASKDWSQPRFLFIGLDWERKNGPMVLRTFARLREEVPGAELHLVGAVPSVAAPGVHVHGRLDRRDPAGRERMERLLAAATCFVMPSRFEPFGMVYVEAAAAGVPSIGTAVGGAADAIGEGGVLVDPGDESALLEAMREMAQPERAERAGALALERSPLFTWRMVAERIVRALGLAGVDSDSLARFL
jgi:glycosyltransferase involved in cell wall biosynthesis